LLDALAILGRMRKFEFSRAERSEMILELHSSNPAAPG
jgi:hypothetical protein